MTKSVWPCQPKSSSGNPSVTTTTFLSSLTVGVGGGLTSGEFAYDSADQKMTHSIFHRLDRRLQHWRVAQVDRVADNGVGDDLPWPLCG